MKNSPIQEAIVSRIGEFCAVLMELALYATVPHRSLHPGCRQTGFRRRRTWHYKQLRILDQGNCIAFAIIGDYAFCRIRLELLIVLWIVLINDIANFCRVAVVVAIDFHLVFDDRFVCIVQQHLDLEETLIVPLDFLELTFDRNISFA